MKARLSGTDPNLGLAGSNRTDLVAVRILSGWSQMVSSADRRVSRL
jgi:hypothetical protein